MCAEHRAASLSEMTYTKSLRLLHQGHGLRVSNVAGSSPGGIYDYGYVSGGHVPLVGVDPS
jgi:hypothetical protein